MEKPIRVRLLGREYTLRVRPEDEALTHEMAAYVSAKMEAFKKAHPEQSEITAAVITALAITEELFTLREQSNDVMTRLDGDLNAMAANLARTLAHAPGARGSTQPSAQTLLK